MVKKTIPQLQEATEITANAALVFDTGSVTKKIKFSNLIKSIKESVRTITITSQLLTTDDDTVLFNAPGGIDAYLPAVADSEGLALRLKNISGELLGIYPSDVGATIDGAAFLDMSGLNIAHTFVCDGANWFIFS